MSSLLLKNGTVVNPSGIEKADILIADGRIESVQNTSTNDNQEDTIFDCAGKLILPGAIDPHVHLALPTPAGLSCDDFLSGSKAALMGGTTAIFDFVTPRRGQSLKEALIQRRFESSHSLITCGLHMGISEWNPAVQRELMHCIEHEQVKSVKAYLAYRDSIGIDYHELEALMKALTGSGTVLMVHAEEGETIARLQREYLARGCSGPVYHAASRPAETEYQAIDKVLEIAARTGCIVYIVHISTQRGAELTGKAKASGIPVFGETCPHYLLFDDSVYDEKKLPEEVLPFIFSPPVRSSDDREGLWDAIRNGWIDVVATDHCPFHLHGQKDRAIHDFTQIPNGTGSIEHRVNLLFTFGVVTGKISLLRMVELVSSNPAEIFGLGTRKGVIAKDFDADLMIWDSGREFTISAGNHLSRADHDLYEGIVMKGSPCMVFHKGVRHMMERRK